MKKKVMKKRCEKVSLSKCEGVCRTYNAIQLKFAYMLEDMPEVKSFRCNVLMEGLSEGDYTTDFEENSILEALRGWMNVRQLTSDDIGVCDLFGCKLDLASLDAKRVQTWTDQVVLKEDHFLLIRITDKAAYREYQRSMFPKNRLFRMVNFGQKMYRFASILHRGYLKLSLPGFHILVGDAEKIPVAKA